MVNKLFETRVVDPRVGGIIPNNVKVCLLWLRRSPKHLLLRQCGRACFINKEKQSTLSTNLRKTVTFVRARSADNSAQQMLLAGGSTTGD